MSSGALYFPHLHLPRDSWMVQVLLYWPQLALVVPMDESSERQLPLSGYAKELSNAGLLRTIDPGKHFIDGFGQAFIELIDTLTQRTQREAQERQERTDDSQAFATVHSAKGFRRPGPRSRVHEFSGDGERMPSTSSLIGQRSDSGFDLYEELVARGLAKRHKRSDWVLLERNTARIYMACFAVSLASLPTIDLDVLTGNQRYLDALSAVVEAGDDHVPAPAWLMEKVFQNAREEILRATLPTPVPPVDLADLVAFKEQHGDLLDSFRRHVDRRALEVVREESAWGRDKAMELAEREIEVELREACNEMEARMHERRWRVAHVLLQIAAPFGAVTAAAVTGDPLTAIAASTAPTFGELLLRMVHKQEPTAQPAPLAYAAAATNRFS